jgi:large subunit ribosomal protein L15
MSDELPGLHELRPAPGSRRERKRVGRGPGSGIGKTAGRGQKGQKARSGSGKMLAGYEGGQMPIYMRLGKLRGPNHKKSMPMGPFRTTTVPVNLAALERFDDGVEVTPDLLRAGGVVRTRKHPIKVLGEGELTKRLTVHAHGFSARARARIEAAGGQVVVLAGAGAAAHRLAAPPAAEPEATEPASEEDVPGTFEAAPPDTAGTPAAGQEEDA